MSSTFKLQENEYNSIMQRPKGAESSLMPSLLGGVQIPVTRSKREGDATATCDKAGLPNDVCPYGQVMSASPNDVAFGSDVVPTAQWANITSLATIGSNIITNEVSNITFA